MWVDGSAYWQGLQMDETALPILLFDLAAREGALLEEDFAQRRFWPLVRAAAGYIVRNGPVTQQDRWEENGGYTPYTLGAAIAALLAAADCAERCGEPALAPVLATLPADRVTPAIVELAGDEGEAGGDGHFAGDFFFGRGDGFFGEDPEKPGLLRRSDLQGQGRERRLMRQ